VGPQEDHEGTEEGLEGHEQGPEEDLEDPEDGHDQGRQRVDQGLVPLVERLPAAAADPRGSVQPVVVDEQPATEEAA
jgi:hypothetical protein